MGRGRILYFRKSSPITLENNFNFRVMYLRRSEWQLEPSVIIFNIQEFLPGKAIDINAKVYKSVDLGTVFGAALSYREKVLMVRNTRDRYRFWKRERLQLITPIVWGKIQKFSKLSYKLFVSNGRCQMIMAAFIKILLLGYDFLVNQRKGLRL